MGSGPSEVMIPLGISQITRYKYNLSLREEGNGNVKLNVICTVENSTSGGHDTSQWYDATSQNTVRRFELRYRAPRIGHHGMGAEPSRQQLQLARKDQIYPERTKSDLERNRISKAMRTIIEPKDHESVLAQWRGTHAKIWIFHVSRNRMAIDVSRKGECDALYIVAVGCERISGPFRWDQADIKIITEAPNQWGEVRRRIVDTKAGFELFCSDVVIVQGTASVPTDPFENFLGGVQ